MTSHARSHAASQSETALGPELGPPAPQHGCRSFRSQRFFAEDETRAPRSPRGCCYRQFQAVRLDLLADPAQDPRAPTRFPRPRRGELPSASESLAPHGWPRSKG